jgi:hypothetical protein
VIPTADLADLSDDARALYKDALHDYNRQANVSGDTQMAAATELTETGYATLSISGNGATLRLDPKAKHFTAAVRTGAAEHPHLTYIEVEVLRTPNDRTGTTFAALYGAEISNRTGQGSPWPQWHARVHHATARDSDHSASILADLTIDHPVLDTINGVETVLIGTLTDIRMWPTGTDITLIDSNRKTPLDEPDMCTYGDACAAKPHPYGPFMPPERDDLDRYLGRPVRVTITPVTLVDPTGQPTARQRITRW